MAGPESRFQKSFFVDSGLAKGSQQKRVIQKGGPKENAFFEINYNYANGNPEPITANGDTPSNCPWGTSNDEREEDPARLNNSHDKLSRSASEKANAEIAKINNFYDQHPECKVGADHHRQINMREKGKGVPWGTLNDMDEAPRSQPSQQAAHRPAPFATSNDVPEERHRRGQDGQQENRVLSQVTF